MLPGIDWCDFLMSSYILGGGDVLINLICMRRMLCSISALNTGYFGLKKTDLNLRGRMWGLLGGGSMILRRVRAFAVENKIGRGGSCQFASGLVPRYVAQYGSWPLPSREPEGGEGQFGRMDDNIFSG